MRGWPEVFLASIALLAGQQSSAQQSNANPLNSSGSVTVGGRMAAYLIRHLPPSSFPDLPQAVEASLEQRGCLIPQTFEAHHPENVAHGSLERVGSSDWAVLCSTDGTVSLLVFFASAAPGAGPVVLASAPETERLEPDNTGALGFNWSIDAASPRQVHEAQAGLDPRPPMVDHDALADAVLDRRSVYHFYAKGGWTLLEMP